MTQTNPSTPSPEITLQENVAPKPETMTKIFFEKFYKNKLAVIGGVLLFIIILSAIFAPVIAPYPPEQQNLLNKLKPPSGEHLMGTDKFGRDIFSRLLYGARVSLLVGFASVLGSITIGTVVGAIAGYFGGIIDAIMMRLVDIVLSIPDIFLLITLVTIFQPGIDKLILIFALTRWTTTARLVRSEFLSLRSREFVLAAKTIGTRNYKIIFSHILRECDGADYRCRDAFRRYRNPCGIGIKLSWIRGSAADGKLGKHASGCTELYDHDPGVVVSAVPGPDDPAHCAVL